MKIYVASSWRNKFQPAVVKVLGEYFDVYDFRSEVGFNWSEIDVNWKNWGYFEYLNGLSHPLAARGFENDFNAMKESSYCVLVLPCGRSAHLEAGTMIGWGKSVYIFNPPGVQMEPELMYKLSRGVFNSIEEIIERIKGEQPICTQSDKKVTKNVRKQTKTVEKTQKTVHN
jgi:hypothetical protein